MRISLIALAATLLAGTAPAFTQTFEEAVAQAGSEIGKTLAARKAEQAKAAAHAAARAGAETDPCTENRQLDKMAFTFSLEKLSVSASFKSCTPYYVDEDPDGRLEVSEAVRRYEDARTGYALVVITPRDASGKSQVSLVKEVRWTGYGTVATLALTEGKTIDLGGKAKLTPQAAPVAPADDDAPNGHDCR